MLFGHGVKRLRKLLTHSRKSFQSSPFLEDLILARSSFYKLTRVLLVLVFFLDNLMKKARNVLLPMHPKATTVHMRGESIVVVWFVIHFKPYLYGAKFALYINH